MNGRLRLGPAGFVAASLAAEIVLLLRVLPAALVQRDDFSLMQACAALLAFVLPVVWLAGFGITRRHPEAREPLVVAALSGATLMLTLDLALQASPPFAMLACAVIAALSLLAAIPPLQEVDRASRAQPVRAPRSGARDRIRG